MINLSPKPEELELANQFMESYRRGNFGKNVLNVSNEEFYHFIRIGKLCEIVFTNYLISKQIPINNSEMLQPCENEFRHGADFILTDHNQEVDIKAGNKSFHTRLLIREDQFQAHIHDLYIGSKWISDSKIEIYGYETGDNMKRVKPYNFGTGPCRHKKLNELKSIEKFIELAQKRVKIT